MTTFTPIPSSPPPAPFLPPTSHKQAAETATETGRRIDALVLLSEWLFEFDGDCDADEVFNDYVCEIEAMEAINA